VANDTEPTAERWTFGGSRIGGKGQRVHAWIDEHGNEMIFKASGSYSVGSVYTASVTRSGADRVTRHGHPVYYGRSDDETLRERLSALHRAAETTLSVAARERADKRDDPVELAIERLGELAAHIPPSQRANFAAYVAYRIGKFWN
jgi:hypothetical protein